MLKGIQAENILFLDIETVSGQKSFHDLNETMQYLWSNKSEMLQKREGTEIPAEEYYERAGIYAEFGKIVCISVGILRKRAEDGQYELRVKSFYGHDEAKLLQEFSDLVSKHYSSANHYLCGHNIKEFDIPYICRRMLINSLPLPDQLDLASKKPWETRLLDTMELWKFGDYKSYTALKTLCGVFDIPTPKDDIDGSDVGRVYWVEDDVERIQVYCRKDVAATAQLFLRYKLIPLLQDDQIIMI